MVRIKQFADDLGISYNDAKKLVMAGRKKKDSGKDVLDRMRERANKRIEDFTDAAKEADRIANEDTNMVLKAKKGKAATAPIEGETPSGARTYIPKKGGTRFAPKVPMMEEIDPNIMLGSEKKKTQKGKKLKRRGDDKKVIKAADGAFVRGMGRAYMGNPRATKLR
tara:strand:- start:1170 stop:1667 length:498 start_codon:yes stop_codon:yes gene_type:complete